ncbi:hypothetical protein NZ30_00760 [Xanthomonas translucens pv. undulosa]|nr:hypothetical protein NZ30_00760 [Xanthomonas translucens pv. undulosa]
MNQLVFGIACFGSCVFCLLSCIQAISQSVAEIAWGKKNIVGVLVQQQHVVGMTQRDIEGKPCFDQGTDNVA